MQGRLLLLVTTILAVSPVSAFAGFDFSDNGQSIDITNMPSQSKVVSYTAATPPGEPAKLQGASRPESDPADPALQIYNERYVPDSVKNKYKLTNSWYGDGMSQPGGELPKQKAPEPFIVEDTPQGITAQPVALAAVKPYAKIESFRARKGEPVREILKRWSQREGTELMWATPDDPVLTKDFSFVGSLENAVTALIRATGKELYTQYRSEGLTPVMMSPASTIKSGEVPAPETQKPLAASPLDLFKADTAVTPVLRSEETRWFALSGASLPEVLQVWAEDEDATLIWEASTTYALKDSVSQVGHFEDAVFKALSQFDGEQPRPVGQLYADPATGRKTLLIRNDTSS